jgi:hypothetical protein
VRCALEALADEEVHVVATLPSGDPASFDAPANSRVLPFVPTRRSSIAPPARSPMAAWVPPRRRSRAAFRSASSPSGAISSRWRAESRWPERERGFRPGLAPERLCAAVRAALFREPGARRAAEGYRAADGAVAAANAIEQLVGSHAAATRT